MGCRTQGGGGGLRSRGALEEGGEIYGESGRIYSGCPKNG